MSGARGWRSACFAMLKAGSACWSLCWGRRVQEGDWEKGGVLEQQAGFSPLGVPAKAANKGALGWPEQGGHWQAALWGTSWQSHSLGSHRKES